MFFVIYLGTVIYKRFYPIKSEVSVGFYLNSANISSPREFIEGDIGQIGGDNFDVSRSLVFGNSNELKKHLIEKFDLIDHYKVDINRTAHYSDLLNVLSGAYSISEEKGMITVTFSDPDRDLALSIAREIVSKINEMDKDFLLAAKNRQLEVCKQQLKYYEEENKDLEESTIRLRYGLMEQGIKVKDWEHLREDIVAMRFLNGQLKYLRDNKRRGDTTYTSLAMALAGFKNKYGITNNRIFNELDKIILNVDDLDKVSDLISANILSINYYQEVQRNINFTSNLIRLNEPNIVSIESPPVKETSRIYYLGISFLGSLYIGLLFLVAVVQLNKYKSYWSELKAKE